MSNVATATIFAYIAGGHPTKSASASLMAEGTVNSGRRLGAMIFRGRIGAVKGQSVHCPVSIAQQQEILMALCTR